MKREEEETMHPTAHVCEACHQAPQEMAVEKVGRDALQWPYRLCVACAHRLTTYSLRPLEWFRLATIHGPNQFHLHDDFYSQEGEALQPREKVLDANLWPAPTLAEATRHLETLVDYAMTRRLLTESDEVIVHLKQYDPSLLLTELQRRVDGSPPPDIEAQAYELAAYVLARHAEGWIRNCWSTYCPETFESLALATARCLPLEEGFRRVVEILNALPARELRQKCLCLLPFKTSMTLDWLENQIQSPVTSEWGTLAAGSQFSWERAVKWLNRGRPLSLVALDALQYCKNRRAGMTPSGQLSSWGIGAVSQEEMRAILTSYLARDPAPRVKQAVAFLLQM